MVEGSAKTITAVFTALYIYLVPAWPQLRLRLFFYYPHGITENVVYRGSSLPKKDIGKKQIKDELYNCIGFFLSIISNN